MIIQAIIDTLENSIEEGNEFLNSENTEGTSDASQESGIYKTVRDSNAPRSSPDESSLASVDGSLEKITDPENLGFYCESNSQGINCHKQCYWCNQEEEF